MNHTPRKRFGQNFLSDDIIIRQIIEAISPKATDHIVEIGPGQAAITKHLIPECQKLSLVEIDRDLAASLEERITENHVTIHNTDALKFDFQSLEPKPVRIVGNLPYNISTPLLMHLFKHIDCIQDMHIMLQKEVVDRMCAAPGEKAYGRLTVMVQYFCEAQPIIDIPPTAFFPEPKVNSAFIRLTPRENRQEIDIEHFEVLVRTAFNARRKTLNNNLKKIMTREQIESAGVDPSLRPEMLSVEDFVKLAKL